MTELKAPPGTIVTRGRELLALNWAGQWLAPGMDHPMPAPTVEGWTILHWGDDDSPIECPACFALIRPERSIAHEHWHDQQTEQWRRDHLGEE